MFCPTPSVQSELALARPQDLEGSVTWPNETPNESVLLFTIAWAGVVKLKDICEFFKK